MMNRSLLLAILFLSAIVPGCKKDSTPEMLPDRHFGRANTIAFYLYDKDGTNIVEKLGDKAFTVEYEEAPTELAYSKDINWQKDIEGRAHLAMLFRGFPNTLNSNYTILIPGYPGDKVSIRYKLSTEGVIGGSWYARIVSLHYNGILVYSETDGRKWSGKIIATKDAGKTTVKTNF